MMQQMASFDTNEFVSQCKTCRCGEGDANIWTRTSENPDKQLQKCPHCQVLKSGPLLLSSKGIGWTSWKKRWFVLTRTSLVFYRSDPNAPPQKGSEPNVSLGGIDLNNSGSVVVKADKKLLTVLFPDGRDGRNFTLKTETLEDLFEWKTALENALAESPSPALLKGQSAILRNEIPDTVDAASEKSRDKRPVKSLVIGRPILLALEDIDGSPSFLEKALRYIEDYGIKVEGILRQSADVEEVERRVREYEQGKNEFSGDEDAHVIGDCIKHVLRELPSSPVPATCCTALVDAYRADRGSRINAMHAAITETFPEPNRRLVQRILKMMLKVASHKSENRMSLSALAACMAPLLLRPLLAGDCELEDDFNMGGDGSIQLLQAAAAANHAQAIVIILLEEYERIFDDFVQEGSSDVYSESEGSDVEDESTDNDALEDDESNDGDNGLRADREYDRECSSSGTRSECDSDGGSDSYDNQASEDQNSESSSHVYSDDIEGTETPSTTAHNPVRSQTLNVLPVPENSHCSLGLNQKAHELLSDVHASKSSTVKSFASTSSSKKHTGKSNDPLPSIKRRTFWGRTSARKNLPMESIDYSNEDEIAIQKLELKKGDLQAKMTEKVQGNAELQKNLERRKEELCDRRLALEQDVERLREELKKENDLRALLEAGLMNSQPGKLPVTSSVDSKTRADLEEITLAEADIINLKQKVADLRGQLSHQLYAYLCNSCQHLYATHQSTEKEQQKNVGNTTRIHQNENSTRRENSALGANSENVKTQPHDLSSPDQQSQKVQPSPTNQSTTKFQGSSHISLTEESTAYGRNTASKKSTVKGETLEKRTEDVQSLSNSQLLSKQQTNITNINSMKSVGSSGPYSFEETVRNAAARSSMGTEETATSASSALAKLTNRLKFLKERRVQLVNELQNLDDASRMSVPDDPLNTDPR